MSKCSTMGVGRTFTSTWFRPTPWLLLACAMALAGNSRADTNLIVNGSFEDPDIGWSFGTFYNIPGWSATTGVGFEIQHSCAGSPYDGAQLIELDSYSNATMLQTITVEPGTSYALRFFYSPRPDVSQESNPVELWIDNVLIDTISGYCTGDTDWQLYQYQTTAMSTSMSVEFRGAGFSEGLGGYLDNVSLVAGEGTVGAEEPPASFCLDAPYPNPFNPVTTLTYALPQSCHARLSVLDMAGREVTLLAQGLQESGTHSVSFNASGLPSGMYVAHLEALGRSHVQKLVLVK